MHGDTPLHAFHARIKARPDVAQPLAHYRVRHDRVDRSGRITLRYLSRLHHIGLGAAYRGLPVHLLVANKNVRVIREDGSLIRELILDLATTSPGESGLAGLNCQRCRETCVNQA